MSLSAIPVPAPAIADPLTLFHLRCAQRCRVRLLSRSARASQVPDPATDFDALYQDQSLTIRLSPPQRAALDLCAQHAEGDFGAIAVTALRLHASGLARQDMDNFLHRFTPDTLPDGCLSLPKVVVAKGDGNFALPSFSEAGHSSSQTGPPTVALARDLRLARREQRKTSRLLRPHLPALAQILLQKQTELAHAGRSSGFSAWLQAHNIPRQSAYRLLGKISKPAPIKALICTTRDPAPAADLELLPDAARFRLSPFHSVLAHRILLDARDRSPRRDLTTPIVHAFLQFLSGPNLATALAWLDHSRLDFPLPTGPIPRYRNRCASHPPARPAP